MGFVVLASLCLLWPMLRLGNVGAAISVVGVVVVVGGRMAC
jgi:hypothetical protein